MHDAARLAGNIREFENAIERAVMLGSFEFILAEDLPETFLEDVRQPPWAMPSIIKPCTRSKNNSS